MRKGVGRCEWGVGRRGAANHANPQPAIRPLIVSVLCLTVAGCLSAPLPGTGEDVSQTVVYRDVWGVPHIYAPDPASGCYAMGRVQAQDRPRQLLENFLSAMGGISAVDGESGLRSDWVAHLWDHYGVAKQGLSRVGEAVRPCLTRFVAGINDHYALHPEDLPEWWEKRTVDEAMVLAFARFFLYSWSIDDGFGDLIRGGVRPRPPAALRGSNQFAVAPERSAEGAAILAIDPHLSWFGVSRFWEFRIHAGELQGSGVTLPGFPTIGLGHNERLAWAMTTGGPDTADVYRLELSSRRPGMYRYRDQWRPFTARTVEIPVKGEPEPRRIEILDSHYGPVVAQDGQVAYALRMAYGDAVRILDAWWELNLGKSYRDAQAALATLQFFPQNVMVADVDGNIYYQRTGRVPRRPSGFDWSRPVDGSSGETEWEDFHPSSELVQLLNPPQGYMQNCNVPPDAMLRESPLQPERYPDYIYSDRGHGPLGGWSNARGARAVQRLEGDSQISVVDAMDIILDVRPFGVGRWLDALREAHERAFTEGGADGAAHRVLQRLLSWDGQLERGSQPALHYYFWRRQLRESGDPETLTELMSHLDGFRTPLGFPSPPVTLTPEQAQVLRQALTDAVQAQLRELGALDGEYGDVFRVGRGDRSWPVGGGGPSELGLSTLRSVGFGRPRPDGQRWGNSGQTATQLVLLERPIRSWSAAPMGQSDRPESAHFRDQAQHVFSPRHLKPTWWTPEQLQAHIESREVLEPAN